MIRKCIVVGIILILIPLSVPMAVSNVGVLNQDATVLDKFPLKEVEILFEDSFEDYPDFVLDFPPWMQIDIDGQHTIGLTLYDYPNEHYVGSYIIFNPYNTIPPMADAPPHSGSKFAACFTATQGGGNDDWLITPQLYADEFDEVYFWARQWSDLYNPERFQVLVSTTGINTTDFLFISPFPYIETSAIWTNYSFDLSQFSGKDIYIAVRCISLNTAFLMLDDFCVTHVVTIPEPDLDCSGKLNWDDVPPGATMYGNFTVSNNGESGSMLNWEIDRFPTWGTWTFEPESGTNLSAGNSTTVFVSVVAPSEKNKNFNGGIKIVNSDDTDDSCSVDVVLKTPHSKYFINHQAFECLQLFTRLCNKFFSCLSFRI